MRIAGFVAALAEQGPTRGPQNVFVNRRIVKDRTIAHAIIDAYSVASIKERSPEVHLFIEMPPDARRRERAPDEGGGALPRAVARARGGAAGARWTRSGRAACRSCSSRPETARRCAGRRRRVPGRARRRHRIRIGGCPSAARPWTARGTDASGSPAPAHPQLTPDAGSLASQPEPATPAPDDPADDPARPVPRHLHHRDRRRRASRSSISTSRTSACCSSG